MISQVPFSLSILRLAIIIYSRGTHMLCQREKFFFEDRHLCSLAPFHTAPPLGITKTSCSILLHLNYNHALPSS